MTRILSIEGNIGSGKSTFNNALKAYFENEANCGGLKICFLLEPVDMWNTIKDENNRTMIECYYADQEKYAFAFQMMAYISRLAILREEYKKGYDIILTERSLFTDQNVFAKMLYDDKKIGEVEYQIYNKWFNEFISEFPMIEFIYIKTDPAVALTRIKKRARVGENIPLEYLQSCNDYHDAWLAQYPTKCVLDGNIDLLVDPNIVSIWINTVNSLIHRYYLKFDGASKGNPGQCGAGFVIYKNDKIIHKGNQYISKYNTNNYAEYSALIIALQVCISLNIKSIDIFGDSLLVIKQLSKEYTISSDNLITLYHITNTLLENFDNYTLQHIPREKNKEADALANKAINDQIINLVDVLKQG
jgi:ribonuclease HI/thymidylate kinase